MKINKETWDEIKSHVPLILTIIIFAGFGFWIIPIIAYPIINAQPNITYTFHPQIGDFAFGIFLGVLVGIRTVIIIEN
jgi:hypothetical protein